jgi:hypothetical protein
MPFLALIIAAVLIVAAIRNTQGQLLTAIRQDVPAFAIWGAAIFGVAMVGFIPGLKPVSRGLLALLIVAIILANYRNVLNAFQGVAYGAEEQALTGTPTGSLGASGAASNGAFLSLLSNIGGGASADYSDALGWTSSPPGATAESGSGSGATSSATIPYENPAKSGAASVVSAVVEAVAAPVRALAAAVTTGGGSGVLSLSNGLPNDPKYGPSPVTASDPNGTAGSRLWQRDTFAYEAQNLAAAVNSGQISKSDPGYQSKLDYLANLTGGVATHSAEMAKLKAMGL